MHKQLKMSATPIALVALTTSMAVVVDSVRAETPAPRPITNESQLIREIGNDPLNVRMVQPVTQVTSVSQLTDVRPTDWAFTALQSLVERYNCIAGYPDRTYRGQQAMTRFEFAAGLNACLDKINEIIASGLADKVSKEDLEAIARLQEDFAAELAALKGRVDTLEGKVATLERQQFSTTTKLTGEVIFAPFFGTDGSGTVAPPGVSAAAIPGIGGAPFGASDRSNLAFGARVRLNFDTSFTGRDLLRTRLQAGNVAQLNTALGSGASTRLGFDAGPAAGVVAPAVEIDDFFYRFPIGNTTVWVAPRLGADNVINPLSPVESSGGGSVSRFGRYPAAIRIGGTNFLLGTRFTLPQGQLNLMYGSSNPSGVTGEGGIFAGGNSKLAAQIVWQPSRDFDLGFTYSYDYLAANSLGTGTNTAGEVLPGVTTMNTNTILGQLRWSFARNVNFFAWGSWTFASALAAAPVNAGNTGTFTSWMTGFSFADLLNRGDLAAIMFGQPFYLASFGGNNAVNPFNGAAGSPFYTTPYHLEAFYRFRVTPNISITPAIFFVFNPNNDSRNGTATVGVLRTTFTF